MLDFAKHLEILKNEPQWLKDERTLAWEKFSQTPMPLQSDESWRLLDLNAIDLDKLSISSDMSKQTTALKSIDAIFEHGDEHHYWGKQIKQHIENAAGILVDSPQGIWLYLNEEIAKLGVIFMTMPEALTKHASLVQSFFAQSSKNNRPEKFTLLNQALCRAGIFIYVPDNVVISKPLVCLNLFDLESSSNKSLGDKSTSLTMSRLALLAGKNSQVSLVNILAGDRQACEQDQCVQKNQHSLINYKMQMHLQAGSKLDYAEVQNFDDNTFAVNHSNYCLERDSRLTALIAAFGAGQLKGEIRTDLKERGAECTVNGIILGNKNECFNFNTIDDHNAPDTKSSIDFRVVLKDEAKSIYHGIIEVAKEAQKTNAFQSNKNLLLGEKAHADSIPKLEILADDVKCSHGATVGPVDRNQLFYLMSRGLSAVQAEELVVGGFFHQLIADCKIEGVSDWLDSMVAEKIINSPATMANTNKTSINTQERSPAALNVSHKKGQPALVK